MAEKYASKCEEIKTLEKIVETLKNIDKILIDTGDLASKLEYKWVHKTIEALRIFTFMVLEKIDTEKHILEEMIEDEGIECGGQHG